MIYGGTVSWNWSKKFSVVNSITEGWVYCHFRSNNRGWWIKGSFTNVVWFLDDYANRTLFSDNGSIAQSKESKVLPVIQYILSLFHTNYEFMWKHDRCIEMQMIHMDLKIVRFDRTKSIPQAKAWSDTGLPFV
jgi:hypothetical protein